MDPILHLICGLPGSGKTTLAKNIAASTGAIRFSPDEWKWGTWGRSEREKLRDEAKALGAKVKFYYLNIPREILRERILKRNQHMDRTEFYIPAMEIEEFLDDCFNSFQIPTAEELATYDFIG